jgi:hypothetical protein
MLLQLPAKLTDTSSRAGATGTVFGQLCSCAIEWLHIMWTTAALGIRNMR